MRRSQLGVVVAAAALVLAGYAVWSYAAGAFTAQTSATETTIAPSCSPASPPCPVVAVESANLTVRTLPDVTSQVLVMKVAVQGPTEATSLVVYFAGAQIGSYSAPLLPGRAATGGWAIPTTISVTSGQSYLVQVRADYSPAGGAPATYWTSVSVVAH